MQNIALNEAAKHIITKDPELFLRTFGTHYVATITYGGSFLGI